MPGQLLFVAGPGRSGSTLLDLLLNSSSQIQSVGEVRRLNWYARTNREPCTCGRPVRDCPFWQRVEEEARQVLGVGPGEPLLETKEMMLWPQDIGSVGHVLQKAALVLGNPRVYRFIAKRFCKAHWVQAENSLFWNEMIRRVTGSSIILDSSKGARRLKVLYLTDPDSFKLIFMVRDGRAVSASAMRRENQGMEATARTWAETIRKSVWAQRSIPARKRLRVHYETLCREPQKTIRRVCGFINIPFDEDMLVLKKKESHNIGGNPMRFRQDETSIRLDERWRQELSAEDLSVFQRIAGRWNRRLGYGDPSDGTSLRPHDEGRPPETEIPC